jgi:hypothetical protein
MFLCQTYIYIQFAKNTVSPVLYQWFLTFLALFKVHQKIYEYIMNSVTKSNELCRSKSKKKSLLILKMLSHAAAALQVTF